MKTLVLAFAVAFLTLFCECSKQEREEKSEPPRVDRQQQLGPTFAVARIYIESVPKGAHVYAAKSEGGKPLRDFGRTPLVLNASECSTREFWIMMHLDEYQQEIGDAVPELKGWVQKVQEYGGQPPAELFFQFFETKVTKSAYTQDGTLAATGPVLELIPLQNRICVLFVPNGEQCSLLQPLMPPKGTFFVSEERLEQAYVNKYGFTENQAKNAIDLLSRCGKAIVAVPKSSTGDNFTVYSITFNGPGAEYPVIEQEWTWDSYTVRTAGLYP